MKILICIIGGLGVFILLSMFLMPYLNKVRVYIKLRLLTTRMRKRKGMTDSERTEINKLIKSADDWIKSERI